MSGFPPTDPKYKWWVYARNLHWTPSSSRTAVLLLIGTLLVWGLASGQGLKKQVSVAQLQHQNYKKSRANLALAKTAHQQDPSIKNATQLHRAGRRVQNARALYRNQIRRYNRAAQYFLNPIWRSMLGLPDRLAITQDKRND